MKAFMVEYECGEEGCEIHSVTVISSNIADALIEAGVKIPFENICAIQLLDSGNTPIIQQEVEETWFASKSFTVNHAWAASEKVDP